MGIQQTEEDMVVVTQRVLVPAVAVAVADRVPLVRMVVRVYKLYILKHIIQADTVVVNV